MNNFENHSLAALEGAIARGLEATATDESGESADSDSLATDPRSRLVDAIWSGLWRLDRV